MQQALYLFNEGRNFQAYHLLGAHPAVAGTTFRVWAPNAGAVSVVGEFNDWRPGVHAMRPLGDSGIWEVLVPEAAPHQLYRFAITTRGGDLLIKSDPYGRGFELRPGSAAYIVPPSTHVWGDGEWLARRATWDWQHAPVNIYEVHAGSWLRHPDDRDGRPYLWRELAERLIPYALEMGYTHLELLPVTEHPLDESWGYQSTGYFAPSARQGSADDLRYFIDACHQAGLGVLLDWVPGHFPQDDWALARYDGTALYEHEDPRQGVHIDWGTHIFNYGRHEVCSFLLSSAHWWLSEFHFDGLRVDAVASMLYLDYSRQAGEWLPNCYGGRENLDAISFLQALNAMTHGEFPGVLTIAEESTAWPQVSRPTWVGGLGFSMKWNMGWMNDSLRYFSRDAIHRHWHHDELTFGQIYAYSENFVLPLSHDEVVHGKGALLAKMPGDDWQRRANLRLLFTWQTLTPGKKLMFMGGEFGQPREWSSARELDWGLLADPAHLGLQRLAADLNRLYRDLPALHEQDFSAAGFSWIDCHDNEQSVLCWLRWARDGRFVVTILNFTPVPRHNYRIGVPQAGRYREILNSDSDWYGGSNLGNGGILETTAESWREWPASLTLTLPPLAAVVLEMG
ncbi:MAG: 1,4-alpha-glucan branching protein GlgB [Betaproteobacteria bacterium]|nr:1,4-alpha-glucan branching protein GlgB [Betaproteobacteria bacterium]MCL2885175.1 1,4-alpha-glucan branching protein GlgB [Betaproteobacteria bacterium]